MWTFFWCMLQLNKKFTNLKNSPQEISVWKIKAYIEQYHKDHLFDPTWYWNLLTRSGNVWFEKDFLIGHNINLPNKAFVWYDFAQMIYRWLELHATKNVKWKSKFECISYGFIVQPLMFSYKGIIISFILDSISFIFQHFCRASDGFVVPSPPFNFDLGNS